MMQLMFFTTGLASVVGQILLLREILVVFHGTEVSIGIFFAAWLAGIGSGAACGAWLTKSISGDFRRLFVHGTAGLGASVIVEIILMRAMPHLFGIAPAELAPLHGVVPAVCLGTIFPAWLTGVLFPLGAKATREHSDTTVAGLYVFEALGGLVGGVCFTFVLVRRFGPMETAGLVASIPALAATWYGLRNGVKCSLLSGGAVVLVGVLLLSPSGEDFRNGPSPCVGTPFTRA
jgi:spermidine synthase